MAAGKKRFALGRARAWVRRVVDSRGGSALVVLLAVVLIASTVALVAKVAFVQVGWVAVALGYAAIPAWAALAALFVGAPIVLVVQMREEGHVSVKGALLLVVATLVLWGLAAVSVVMGVAEPLSDVSSLDDPATVTLSDVQVERDRGARSGVHFFSLEGTSEDGAELSFTVSRELYERLRDTDAVRVTYLPHSKVVVGLEAEPLR